MLDNDIQEKTLSTGADKEMKPTLQDITNTVEALEMAKRDQATLIGGHGDLNRHGPTTDGRLRAGISCSSCGLYSHRISDASCRALDMNCRGCQMKGYMAAYCGRSIPTYDLRKPQEVSRSPKNFYLSF